MEPHIPHLYVLLWSKLWFTSEKAVALSPAAFQVPILSCLAVPNMPQAYGAYNENNNRVSTVLQAVQLLITVYVHVLPFLL